MTVGHQTRGGHGYTAQGILGAWIPAHVAVSPAAALGCSASWQRCAGRAGGQSFQALQPLLPHHLAGALLPKAEVLSHCRAICKWFRKVDLRRKGPWGQVSEFLVTGFPESKVSQKLSRTPKAYVYVGYIYYTDLVLPNKYNPH